MSEDRQRQSWPKLFARGPGRILPDLGRIESALADLNHPERDFPSILVVGTNGKGSTVAMLASILRASGLRVGRYTSPHLVDVRERIRVDGLMISEGDFQRILGEMENFPDLSFFETLTVMAFVYFSQNKIDVAVLEAGMGGRWDATRTGKSEIVGLSSLALDHAAWLGESLEEIASDKGSALAAAEISILAPSVDESLLPALGAPAAEWASRRLELKPEADDRMYEAIFKDGRSVRLRLPLSGVHQLSNLHLALALGEAGAARGYYPRLEADSIIRGLKDCEWPGRLGEIQLDRHRILLDGAHNVEAAMALAAELERRGEVFDLLFSCLDDKPAEAMADALRPHVGRVVVCPLADARAMNVRDLRRAWPEARCADDPISGLAMLGDLVVAAGSLRLVGAMVKAELQMRGASDVEKIHPA